MGPVIIVADLNQAGIEQTVDGIRAAGGQAFGFWTDISKQEQTCELMDKVAADHGLIDTLANNAGISRCRPFAATTGED